MVAILPVDQHVHRFLRRSYETESERDIYVKTFLTFGDRLAPTTTVLNDSFIGKKIFSCPKQDLNPRPPDYRSGVITMLV